MRRDLEVRKRVSGPNHPDTLSAMVNLALDYMEGNRLPDAEGLLRDVIDADRKVLGPDHMDTTYSMEKLGLVLMREEKWGEAEKMLRASLASYERAVGPSDYFTGRARLDLIQLYMKSGETRKMDEAIREAIRVSPNLIMLNQASWAYLTVNPASARRPREALELARRCVKLAPEDPDVLNTVGLAEVRNGLWDEAIRSLEKAASLHRGESATDYLFLALAYHGRGDKADSDTNYERGARLALAAPEDKETQALWRETAVELGKPISPSLKGRRASPQQANDRDKRQPDTAS